MDIDESFSRFIANEIPLYFVVGFKQQLDQLSRQSFINSDIQGDKTTIKAWHDEKAAIKYMVTLGEFSDQLKIVPLIKSEFYKALGDNMTHTALQLI